MSLAAEPHIDARQNAHAGKNEPARAHDHAHEGHAHEGHAHHDHAHHGPSSARGSDHKHGPHEGALPAPKRARPALSLLRMSALQRLSIALAGVGGVWLGVVWAWT